MLKHCSPTPFKFRERREMYHNNLIRMNEEPALGQCCRICDHLKPCRNLTTFPLSADEETWRKRRFDARDRARTARASRSGAIRATSVPRFRFTA